MLFLTECPGYTVETLKDVTCRQFNVIVKEIQTLKRLEAGEENVDIYETNKKVVASVTGPTACAILDRIMPGRNKKKNGVK